MESVKIAHCADIHMCSKFRKFSVSKANLRNSEIKNSFLNLLKYCDSKIDLFLIAGDLFDSINVSKEVLEEIKYLVKSVNFKVIISPGNHDFYVSDVYENWSENVFVFKKNKLEFFDFKSLNTRVWGCSFTNVYSQNFKLKVDNLNSKIINIGLVHGDIWSNKNNCYNSILLSEIESTGFEYLALGHIHNRTEIKKIGDVFYAYSGCLEGRGFDELGEKGFYIGEISKNCVNLKFKKFCKRMYIEIKIDITNLRNNIEVCEKINKKLSDLYGQNYEYNSYKIILVGEVPEEFFINIRDLELKLENLFYVEISDSTEVEANFNKICDDFDLKNIFIKSIKEKINNSTSENDILILKNALKIGIRAFRQEVFYDN
ncbi:MAG: DNA repair exonuclease [Candidatus Paraimprobicoccus trichonymphae]|uniref:DNA repair exonuclease n=1 Tax=Candidatus Paraimprobicoccus trichonymphae TaxID=3033793 RepID=A0AA48I9B1_9FIRM|nr:MAG: DNA repair exonuclease [Candidatus Paraimprobicoccus trichonymphae]